MRAETLTRKIKGLVLKKLEKGNLPQDEQEKLEAAIDALLEKDLAFEQDIINVILEDLDEIEGACDIFLNELEVSATMQTFPDKNGEKASLLFAIPVAFLAGDQFRRVAFSTDDTREMCDVLVESDVISGQVKFGILPRLFTPAELQAQGYGMLQRLTRSLGRKLRDGEPLRLENGILNEKVVASDKFAWGDNPHIDLRLLVGAAYTPVSELDSVFPPVGPEEVEHLLIGQASAVGEDGEPAHDETSSSPTGIMPDGEFWETPFCEAVTSAFFSMRGCRGAILPADINESLRSALEYWREFGLTHQIELGFAETEKVILDCSDYDDPETGRYGWQIEMSGEDGTSRGSCRWEVLMHETADESRESLADMGAKMGWEFRSLAAVEFPQ